MRGAANQTQQRYTQKKKESCFNSMPTIFSHAVFAAATGKSFLRQPASVRFWLLTAACAMISDADVVTRSFGVERGTLFSHRGFTHSIVFALIFGALAALIAVRFLKIELSYRRLFIFFALAVLSHPLLDMLTDGGSGVALFAPFSNERFFFPWRPVEVSPIGFAFFSERGIDVIISEIIWLWFPAIALLTFTAIIRRARKRR